MGAEDQRIATLSLIWGSNIGSSVLIIFLNRLLMGTYKFTYVTTMSGIQFLATFTIMAAGEQLGLFKRDKGVAFKHSMAFALVGSLALVAANFSLLWNGLGMYQLVKLLVLPSVLGLEFLLVGRRLNSSMLGCLALVLIGVVLSQIPDLSTLQLASTAMAMLFVVCASLQQVMCGRLQAMYAVSPYQLLMSTSALQSALLLLGGPVLDWKLTGSWVLSWEINVPGLEMLAATCIMALAVNLTQYILLSQFSATTYQVVGYIKTIFVVLGGWLLFHKVLGWRQFFGMTVTITGVLGYSVIAMKQAMAPHSPTIKAPFLQASASSGGDDGVVIAAQSRAAGGGGSGPHGADAHGAHADNLA